jgi:hypothetical protein
MKMHANMTKNARRKFVKNIIVIDGNGAGAVKYPTRISPSIYYNEQERKRIP